MIKGFDVRLQQLLDSKGLSAAAFAKIIGVPRSILSHIFSGRNNPSLDFVMKVLDSFPEITFDELVLGKQNNPTNHQELSASKKLPITMIEENLPNKNGEKNVDKIVILYTDKSFEIYK